MKYTTFIAAVALCISSSHAEDPWTPSPLCPFPSNDLTRFPFEGDCSKYWECYQGARYPMDCPAGLEFHAEANRCDDPSLANCDPDVTIIYPTFPHSTETTTHQTGTTEDTGPEPECPFPSDDLTFYPVATNCSQYWECFQGNRYLMSCPSGLYWNVLANYCDYKENVDCKLNTPTPGPGTTRTPAPETTTSPGGTTEWTPDPLCPYPSHEITYFVHVNCSKYYECYEGKKYIMSCPDGLYWNHLADVCDHWENVDCDRGSTTHIPPTTSHTPTRGPTTTPEPTYTPTPGPTTTSVPTVDPTATTTTANPICINEPDGTYLPHPTDCSKFYECAGGKTNEEQCPGNLLWNQSALTCDYPDHVDCP